MSTSVTIRVFATADGVMQHAARTLLRIARAPAPGTDSVGTGAIEDRAAGRVAVALSGGSTPARLYERIAEAHRDAIAWDRIDVFFGDERAVAPEHPESNYRLAADRLLSRVPIPPARIHRMPADDADPDAAARRHEEEIRRAVPTGEDGVPVFDLIWLGLGTDGHTASLFPGAPALEEETRLVVPAEGPMPFGPMPKGPLPEGAQPPRGRRAVRRMTFTLPLLAAAARIQFLVVGAEKADAVRRVLEPREGEGPPLPAARVSAARGEVEWLLDRAAAAGIQDPGLIARSI